MTTQPSPAQTYTERTESAASVLEQALRAQFKAAGDPPITYERRDRTYNIRDRETRILIVAAILDEYYRDHGEFNQRKLDEWYVECERRVFAGKKPAERPSPVSVNTTLIDRLTDVVLYDELADSDRMKTRTTEYPFFSDTQLERRRAEEVPEKIAEEYGADRRNHAAPERRHRTRKERTALDRDAKIHNRERAAKYRKETTAGPVRTVVSEPFTQCRGIAAKWRAFSDRDVVVELTEDSAVMAA